MGADEGMQTATPQTAAPQPAAPQPAIPPSTAPPQPGPPAAQPVSSVIPPASAAAQSPLAQRGADFVDQIYKKYRGQLTPPQPTGNMQVDRANQIKYHNAQVEADKLASAEVASKRQQMGMMFQATKQEQAQQAASAAADKREQAAAAAADKREQAASAAREETQRHADAAAKERQDHEDMMQAQGNINKITDAARSPMNDKDFHEAIQSYGFDKIYSQIPNLKPTEQQTVKSAISNGQYFNKDMDTDQVADFVRGMVTGQYTLDRKATPKDISDPHGDRSIFTFNRDDGSKGHIAMMHDDMDNIAQMIKSRIPKPAAAGKPTIPYPGQSAIVPPAQRPAYKPLVPGPIFRSPPVIPNEQVPQEWRINFLN